MEGGGREATGAREGLNTLVGWSRDRAPAQCPRTVSPAQYHKGLVPSLLLRETLMPSGLQDLPLAAAPQLL